METGSAVKTIRNILAVIAVVSAVTRIAAAQNETRERTFAVFVVSYNSTNDDAVGGVAGTAFFVSSHRAVTAYHVLQPSSFRPRPGYEHVRVWLVHERHAPIELKIGDIDSRAERDVTTIAVAGRGVDSQFVFTPRAAGRGGTLVHAEGFLANTAGPILSRAGAELTIVSVPRLERVRAEGRLLVSTRVNLKSDDLHLKAAPCLQLSYRPVRGMSGGPVLVDGHVVGMNSFADPAGGRTWAVDFLAD